VNARSPADHALAATLVVPAYREGARLAVSLQRVLGACRAHFDSFEVIVVVDGPDGPTLAALDDARREPAVRVLVNGQNRGKGYSVRRGVLEARGRSVLFTDADLSVPIENALALVAALEQGADVAIASRTTGSAVQAEARPFGREAMSHAFSTLVQATFLPGIRDSQCGLKGFRFEAARRLFGAQRIDRFAFDVEVLWLARRWGYRIVEIPVTCVYYSHSSVRRSVDSISMLRDLARIGVHAAAGSYEPGRGLADADRDRRGDAARG
jgi:dolichyl-phosphate beta-glucosyltransferase